MTCGWVEAACETRAASQAEKTCVCNDRVGCDQQDERAEWQKGFSERIGALSAAGNDCGGTPYLPQARPAHHVCERSEML
jgi:hypothetical protein